MVLATVIGEIVGIKKKLPVGDQDFKPHQVLSVLQKHDGDAETVKIKEKNYEAGWEDGAAFDQLCIFRPWNFGSKSGLSISILEAE